MCHLQQKQSNVLGSTLLIKQNHMFPRRKRYYVDFILNNIYIFVATTVL